MKTSKVIGIDLSMVDNFKAGIAYYAYSLSNSLINEYPQNKYYLYTNNKESIASLNKKNVEIIEVKGKINLFWHLKVLITIKRQNLDFFISPSNFFYGIYYKNSIQIVHDIAPYSHPESFNKQSVRAYNLQLKKLSKSKCLIATNSKSTKDDLISLYPNLEKRVHEIGTGLSSWLKPQKSDPAIAQIQAEFNISAQYILSIGTIQPRKNYIRAIKAFYEFQKTNECYSYVIVGKYGWLYQEIITLIKELELEQKVLLLGYQSEENTRTLLANARIFLQASVWEGFGMPLLEAYSFGLPIAASNIKVFNDIFGDKITYFDAENELSILDALNTLKNPKVYKVDLEFLSQFDWSKVAYRLMQKASCY